MCGKQFAFDSKNQDQIAWLLEIVKSRIADTYDVYNINNDKIVYIQIAFRKLEVKLLTNFALDKNFLLSESMPAK